jgi:FkbM family methyltransferase
MEQLIMSRPDPTSFRLHRKDCRHGAFTYYATDNTIGRCLTEYGEWAEAEVALFSRLVSPGDTVVEGGANIGIHTLPLSRMVGSSGTVYAFEPMACNNQLLSANIVANDIVNVRNYQMALGEINTIIPFPSTWADHKNNFGAYSTQALSIHPTLSTIPCASICIDSLSLSRLDLIKIDVEGGEPAVIIGAMKAIANCRPAMLVETKNEFAVLDNPDGHLPWIISQLKPLSYSFWHYITPLYNEENWRSNRDNLFEGQWSFDVLCLPTERFAVTGLENAEAGTPPRFDPDAWRSMSISRMG